MFCMRKNIKPAEKPKSGKGSAFAIGMLMGAAATATFCIVKKIKKKKAHSKQKKGICLCDENDYENFDEDCGCLDDYERARNGCGNLSGTEECDTDILHSSGCLGYPHDEYGGFADSKGDRPNDLSCPEAVNRGTKYAEQESPYQAKNKGGKSNPQPENRVNEVKKK